jgi:glycosyltransferase involved in cell wall biosynthesis
MELDSFRQAAKITIASPSWAIDLQNIGAKNVDVLYYGYDESDFSHAEQLLNSDEIPSNLEILRNKFVISHLGLMGSDRNPKTMLGVISELTEKSEELKSDLLLFFPGEVDYVIRKEIEQLNLTAHSMLPGHISKSDSILAMLLSSVLLLLLNKADNVKGRLPGKIYEYLRAYKTILTLGPEDSDVGEILTKTRGGVCIDYENTSGIRNFILESYALWKNNNLPPVDKKEINFFDVQNQTKYLAQLLDEITG